ncbi:Protein of uncharacterised function (DUF2756) [Pantoea agglomerans]|uniref:Protein of uncharacterized function (DUF2756) n=1 Tax=Enterobacter agglomerans TaxID=549 RepID=A0A379AAL3_ENTAG|nr:Protein of uncharacterised function (DUF2756) [Pantoea agglomerans]
MKKWMIILAALLPFASQANTLNSTNDPNKPGYNPSQQRMQSQMQTQQATATAEAAPGSAASDAGHAA